MKIKQKFKQAIEKMSRRQKAGALVSLVGAGLIFFSFAKIVYDSHVYAKHPTPQIYMEIKSQERIIRNETERVKSRIPQLPDLESVGSKYQEILEAYETEITKSNALEKTLERISVEKREIEKTPEVKDYLEAMNRYENQTLLASGYLILGTLLSMGGLICFGFDKKDNQKDSEAEKDGTT